MERCADRLRAAPAHPLRHRGHRRALRRAPGTWGSRTTAREPIRARSLVSGVGPAQPAHVPRLPGLESFRGASFHSARWNHDVDLAGKRVAVIGNGAAPSSSSPRSRQVVERLHVFQRQRQLDDRPPRPALRAVRRRPSSWSTCRRAAGLAGRLYWEHRGLRCGPSWPGTRCRRAHAQRSLGHTSRTRSPTRSCATQLTPDYPIGCKRILIARRLLPGAGPATTSSS